MWMRFVAFWVLVSLILLIVFSCIVGRPVLQLYFRRCCEEDIENDHVIFENFGNNFLRERLIGNPDLIVVNEDDDLIADLVTKEPLDHKYYLENAKFDPVKFVNVHDIESRYNNEFSPKLRSSEDDYSIVNRKESDSENDDSIIEKDLTLKHTENELIEDEDSTKESTEIEINEGEHIKTLNVNISREELDNNSIITNLIADSEINNIKNILNNDVDLNNDDENQDIEEVTVEMTTESKTKKETTIIR